MPSPERVPKELPSLFLSIARRPDLPGAHHSIEPRFHGVNGAIRLASIDRSMIDLVKQYGHNTCGTRPIRGVGINLWLLVAHVAWDLFWPCRWLLPKLRGLGGSSIHPVVALC